MSAVPESKLLSSDGRKGSRTSRYISWAASALIVLIATSYLSFGYFLNQRITFANERSQLIRVYEGKSLTDSQILDYTLRKSSDTNKIEKLVTKLIHEIDGELILRPSIRQDFPGFSDVATNLKSVNDQLISASTSEQRTKIMEEISVQDKRLNKSSAALNHEIDIELKAITKNFYFVLALSIFSFLFLAYLLMLMRTTIARISQFTSQIIRKLGEGSTIDLPAKAVISESKLLPGADLLVGETVKLAQMYRDALVKERELFEEQKVLSDKFEATNFELVAAREETFRAAQLSAIGKVAGSVSHEINNPITGILGYIAYVRKKSTDPDLVKYLEKAQKEVERIGRIAKSLLVFSRHNVIMPSSKFDLASSVENVAVLAGPQLHDSLVEIDVAPLADLPPVIGRVDEFQQCLLNMVLNARDALEGSQERKIWISGRVNGEKIELLITDSGPGVPEKFREFLFQPFHTTKPAGEGSGLGLSVCRELMARMGGTAEFDPTYGPGARFILALPIFNEPVVTPQATTAL